MYRTTRPRLALALMSCLLATACNFGRVSQGRAVAYDRDQGVVTLVPEAGVAGAPNYTLPPVRVRIPQDAKEMGPAPDVGNLLLLDAKKNQAIAFLQASQTLTTIPFKLVSEEDGVVPSDPRLKKAKLPSIDREKKTVTLYSARQEKLLTLAVAAEYLDLPEETWKAGDELRYYYKQPGQALRMMNVTKTDVREGG